MMTVNEIRKVLEDMQAEAIRCMQTTERPGAKVAWYYSQVGAWEAAQQIGVITDAERQKYVKELGKLGGYPLD